jgi:N-acetylmuramoyl-L-alanine amidase
MRFSLILILLLKALFLAAQDTKNAFNNAPFLSIIAKNGDDIPKILELYELADYDCNITQFLKLNRLSEGDYRLVYGKTYVLPIKIMKYNGKSIRSTIGVPDWETAVRIRDYNLLASQKKLRSDVFTESKQLWVPWHEVACDMEASEAEKTESIGVSVGRANIGTMTKGKGEVPLEGGKRLFPIFGKKHSYTPLLSSRLNGKVFFLVSGHGGPDPGAQGKRAGVTLSEDEYAYDVTLRLLRYLLSHGAIAYMIVRDPNDGIRDENYLKSDKDEVVWGNREIPLNQKERLGQRTDIINSLSAYHKKNGQTDQTIIEIHIDSRSVATEIDVFFYYKSGSTPSMRLAETMHQVFSGHYKDRRSSARAYSGSVSTRDLFTFRETNTRKAVYVELANIRNDWDQQRLVLSSNRQAMANWIGEAILKR